VLGGPGELRSLLIPKPAARWRPCEEALPGGKKLTAETPARGKSLSLSSLAEESSLFFDRVRRRLSSLLARLEPSSEAP